MSSPLPQDGPPGHDITFVDGRFASAACSCGWLSAGRRDRRIVRQEALDHLTLFAVAATPEASGVPAPAQPPRETTEV